SLRVIFSISYAVNFVLRNFFNFLRSKLFLRKFFDFLRSKLLFCVTFPIFYAVNSYSNIFSKSLPHTIALTVKSSYLKTLHDRYCKNFTNKESKKLLFLEFSLYYGGYFMFINYI